MKIILDISAKFSKAAALLLIIVCSLITIGPAFHQHDDDENEAPHHSKGLHISARCAVCHHILHNGHHPALQPAYLEIKAHAACVVPFIATIAPRIFSQTVFSHNYRGPPAFITAYAI